MDVYVTIAGLVMRPSASWMIRSQRPGDDRVVGGDQQRGVVLSAQLKQEVEDLGAGVGVQVAGRLIGQQQDGVVDQGVGDRDALLLPAGELVGVSRPVRPTWSISWRARGLGSSSSTVTRRGAYGILHLARALVISMTCAPGSAVFKPEFRS